VTAEGDVVHMLWRAQTPETTFPFGTNTFVVRDGKIAYHTIAFVAEARFDEGFLRAVIEQEAVGLK
jgi:hypothetical protein